MKQNIQKFDELVGRIFSELYESFPVPKSIKADVWDDYMADLNEGGLGAQFQTESDFFNSTVEWLMHAGFIRYKEINFGGRANGCVLTAKGLEILKAIPKSLEPSLGEKLIEASKSGVVEQVRSLTGQALSYGVSLALSATGIASN